MSDELLGTRDGLTLANTAFQEGAAHMLRAVRDNENGKRWATPRSPYSAPLLRMMGGTTEERAAMTDLLREIDRQYGQILRLTSENAALRERLATYTEGRPMQSWEPQGGPTP